MCEPDALPRPETLPAEVVLPPDLKITSVDTSPHMVIMGISTPPDVGTGAPPYIVVANAMRDVYTELGWRVTRVRTEGEGYEFRDIEGRNGAFYTRPFPGCEGRVDFTIEVRWLTG